MRRWITAFLMLVMMGSCNEEDQQTVIKQVTKASNGKNEAAHAASAAPVEKEFNVGMLRTGDSIEHVFEIRNTGSLPVVIKMVKASCGCTTVDWKRDPVLPGRTGWIRSRLKAGDPGRLRKSVVAQLNTGDPFMVFYLVAEVIPKSLGSKKTTTRGPEFN